MLDVCVVGSANLDLVAGTDRLPRPGETVLGSSYREHAGGKGLNQAIAAARAGASTAFIGAIGADAAGRRLLDELDRAGVDASAVVQHADLPTGRALIAVESGGENLIVVVPGANATVVVDVLPPARVVLVQLEIPIAAVAQVLRGARATGARTVLNPAPATETTILDLAALIDVIVPNEHEAHLLGGVDAWLECGVGAVVTTLGAAGVDVATATQRWHVPPFAVDAVDSTGAGDAFCGALAGRLAAGDELAAAVRFAAAAGALATTTIGAVPSIPTADAIRALVATVSGERGSPPNPPA